MFHPWLWIEGKNRLYCCKTSPNTRLKHTHEAVFVLLWVNAAPILRWAFSSKFSINIRCAALCGMLTMSVSSRTFSRRSSNTILNCACSITIRYYYTRSRKSKWSELVAKCQVQWTRIMMNTRLDSNVRIKTLIRTEVI